MPKKYIPFDVMKETASRKRLAERATILYGAIGSPPKHFDMDQRVAWLDLVSAAPPGRLEAHHRKFLEMVVYNLIQVRSGEANKSMARLLGTLLRDMGLTPKTTAESQSEVLLAFKGRGAAN